MLAITCAARGLLHLRTRNSPAQSGKSPWCRSGNLLIFALWGWGIYHAAREMAR